MASKDGTIVSLLFGIGRKMRDGEGEAPRYAMLHFHALRYIEGKGKPLMRELAAFLRVTPPAATLLVEGLVKDGLLARSLDVKDRRAVRIMLTQKGKTFLAQGIRKKMRTLKKLFSVLSPKEHDQLIALLRKIGGGDQAV